MPKRPVINTVPQIVTNTGTINTNFENIRNAFDNTLSRDGSTPNQMLSDIDFNGNDALNVGTLEAVRLRLNGDEFDIDAVFTAQQEAEAARDDAQAAQLGAETAEQNAETARDEVIAATARTFDDVADLLAYTGAGFGVGSIWQAAKEGRSYEQAPDAATDNDRTTAGGIKLYSQPTDVGFINALDYDGADIAEKLNRAIKETLAGTGYMRALPPIVIPPGEYTMTTGPIDLATATAFRLSGQQIWAHGAVIRNSENFPVLSLRNQLGFEWHGGHIVAINAPANVLFDIQGNASRWVIDGVGLIANSTSDFSFIRSQQVDPANPDTGSFWGRLSNFWCRKNSGSDPGSISVPVDLIGAANAIQFLNTSFANFTHGVRFRNHAGQNYINQGADFVNPRFEQGVNCIRVESDVASVNLRGPSLIASRYENVTRIFSFSGITQQPSQAPFIMASTFTGPITELAENPNGLNIDTFERSATGLTINPRLGVAGPISFENLLSAGSNPTMRVQASQAGSIVLHRIGSAIVDGNIRQAAGGGMLLDGGTNQLLYLTNVRGLTGGTVRPNNFRGTATLAAATTTIAVTFPTAEADANYRIALEAPYNATLWVTDKTTTGFTINASVAPGSNTVIAWLLWR
jgi:hypothetical protein